MEPTHPKCRIGPEMTAVELQLIFKAAISFVKMIERTERPAVIINPRSGGQSVLVSVTGEVDGVVYATFLMNVDASLLRKDTEIDERAHKNWKVNYMPAREVESGQWWCVR